MKNVPLLSDQLLHDYLNFCSLHNKWNKQMGSVFGKHSISMWEYVPVGRPVAYGRESGNVLSAGY